MTSTHGLTQQVGSGSYTRAHPLYWVWQAKKKRGQLGKVFMDVEVFVLWAEDNGWKYGRQIRRHNPKRPCTPKNCYVHTVIVSGVKKWKKGG